MSFPIMDYKALSPLFVFVFQALSLWPRSVFILDVWCCWLFISEEIKGKGLSPDAVYNININYVCVYNIIM